MKIFFRHSPMNKTSLKRLAIINNIVEEYQSQGLVLTLRQLYYQLVSRDIIANKQTEYKKLGRLLLEGRMCGIVDWEAIDDRLRVVQKSSSWNNPKDIINSAAYSFALPRQQGQKRHVEVWIEKDALSGVVERVVAPYHIPLMVNRGYSSASAMHDAFERFWRAAQRGQSVSIIYLGDHDPSGKDMIRDIHDRITEFMNGPKYLPFKFHITGIALTMDQIEEYDPPPNPAKITDPRATQYIEEFGESSWEVDALRPEVLNQIITDAITERIDMDLYKSILEKEEGDKARLGELVKRWSTIEKYLNQKLQ